MLTEPAKELSAKRTRTKVIYAFLLLLNVIETGIQPATYGGNLIACGDLLSGIHCDTLSTQEHLITILNTAILEQIASNTQEHFSQITGD
jgi:hypothetical protein